MPTTKQRVTARIYEAVNRWRTKSRLGDKLSRLYLGRVEYEELERFTLDAYGFSFTSNQPFRNPASDESTRPEFDGMKIYRVDATTHLEVA